MTDLEKAARLALEALEYYQHRKIEWDYSDDAAITALRQALEQPQDEWLTGCPECGMDGECGCDKQPAQQEPIGYTDGINWQPRQSEMVVKIVRNKQPEHGFVHAIYTSPQRKSWVGLTREEKQHIIDANFGGSRADCMDEAERILRRKNT